MTKFLFDVDGTSLLSISNSDRDTSLNSVIVDFRLIPVTNVDLRGLSMRSEEEAYEKNEAAQIQQKI